MILRGKKLNSNKLYAASSLFTRFIPPPSIALKDTFSSGRVVWGHVAKALFVERGVLLSVEKKYKVNYGLYREEHLGCMHNFLEGKNNLFSSFPWFSLEILASKAAFSQLGEGEDL